MACIGMQPHDAKGPLGGFIDGDKGHRARIVEVNQSGDELVRKSLIESKKRRRKSSLLNSREGSMMTGACAFGRRTAGQYCSV